MPVMLLLLHLTLLRDLLLPLRLCLFLPESLVILMLLLLPEMLHFVLLLAALHLAVAPTLHGPALSVHLGTASSVRRIMDHPKASATTMAIIASETSFNARHASPAAILPLRPYLP